MDSYYPGELPKSTDWEEVENIPLPSSKPQKKTDVVTPSKKDNLKTALQENEDLMNRLSVTLRKNSFIESKICSLKKLNQQLTDKNIFLQDQFLILKEKHLTIVQSHSRFTQNIQSNSQQLKNLKEHFEALNTKLKTTKKEKSHALSLNRYLIGKLRTSLKESKRPVEEKWNTKQQNLLHQYEYLLSRSKKQNKQNEKHINQIVKEKESLTNQYTTQIKQITGKCEKEIQLSKKKIKEDEKVILEKNNIISNLKIQHQKELKKQSDRSIKQHIKQVKQLSHLYNNKEATRKAEYEQKNQEIINKNSTLITDLKKQISKLKTQYQKEFNALKKEYDKQVKKQEEQQKQIIRGNEKTIKQARAESDRILMKYEKMKQKWHKRIAHILDKKNKMMQKISSQYEENKKELIQSFKESEENIKLQNEKERQQIHNDFAQNLKKQTEEKTRIMEDLKQGKEEQHQAHIQSTQELIHAHNQAIAQVQEKHKQQTEEVKTQNKDIIKAKEKIISELNSEVEYWSQSYVNYEKTIQQKIEDDFEKAENKLTAEKEEALSKMELHYEQWIDNMKEKQKQELKNLKEKYETEFYEKASKLDDRMIELKEEHDNQLHTLRVEMESELLAEKRKATALNEQNVHDIQKLQKDYRQLQSELELKNLKMANLTLESTSNMEELKTFKEDNRILKIHNNKLQTLWETQAPEMEEQKQQISSLQKLNRQLSQYIQENQSDTYKRENKEKNGSKTNIRDLLKKIHIYDKEI